MADVITRFKLETTQYDSKLRDEAKRLSDFTRQCSMAGNEFGKFAQKNVEAARALGSFAPSATNAKDKVKELVGAFNDAAKAYNALTKEQQQSDFGKAMAESIGQLNQKLREAKQELYSMGDSVKNVGGIGLFGGGKLDGMLQVFGGNLMTKAAGMAVGFASEIGDAVKQGIELAKAGEGIRIAFERLGRGDILDGLRQATHGTVTDLELMKAAVKFNDFKLPLDELGTMLAFAQQKAKDTGQSVDYMVDSIVTGLGRKSLMILDNLGLSATEVKDKMAETGDMTKAVGAIIREQMSKAGDYVETAADRAAQADVELKNAMEELGRTFQPLTDASDSLWNSIKVGALNALNTAVKPLIQALSEAGTLGQSARSSAGFNNLGGNTKVDRMISRLGNGKSAGAYSIYQQQLGEFDKFINNKRFQIAAFGGDNSSVAKSAKAKLQTELDGALKMREEYVKRAQELHNQVPSPYEPPTTSSTTNDKGGSTTTHKATAQETAANKVKEAERTYAETLLKNSIRMEEGMDTTLEYKKRELSAQERLFDAYNDAYATYQDPAYKKASTEAAEKIKTLAGEVKAASDAQEAAMKSTRELDAAQRKLADAQQKLAEARATGSATAIYQAQKNVDKQQDVVNRLQNPTLPAKPQQPTGFEALKQTVQAEIKFDQMKVDETALHTLFKTALQNGIDHLTPDYAGLQERIAKGIDIPDSTWIELQNEINEKLKELGIDPIKIDFKTGKIDESGKTVEKSWQAAAQAVQSVNSALQGLEDPGAKIVGIIGQAIANIALGFSEATTAAAAGGPFAWIAAIAGGIGTMVSTIAAIHSATGYAEGGIVKGNSFSGDNIPAMLNAGETVLTAAQTKTLASNIRNSGLGNLNLTATVTGEQIRFVLNNNGRRTGHGEYVQANFVR